MTDDKNQLFSHHRRQPPQWWMDKWRNEWLNEQTKSFKWTEILGLVICHHPLTFFSISTPSTLVQALDTPLLDFCNSFQVSLPFHIILQDCVLNCMSMDAFLRVFRSTIRIISFCDWLWYQFLRLILMHSWTSGKPPSGELSWNISYWYLGISVPALCFCL